MCDIWVVLLSWHTPSTSRCLDLLAQKSQVQRPAAHLSRKLAANKRSVKTRGIAHPSFTAHVTFAQFHNNCKDIDGTDLSVYHLTSREAACCSICREYSILISRHHPVDLTRPFMHSSVRMLPTHAVTL
jgi:hypothetical protein